MAISNLFETKYSEWKSQWEDKRVQDVDSGYDFVSSESTLLASGPPVWNNDAPEESLIPVGLVQNANISQNKQIQQLNEVGSRQLFTIPGRVFVQVGIARVLFDGPSLLFALHSYYNGVDGKINIPKLSQEQVITPGDKPSYPYPDTERGEGYQLIDDTTSSTELNAFWNNLASSIFNKPMGFGFIFMDTQSDFFGGLYLEECYVQSYNIGISAQQTVILENVQIRCRRPRPIQVS